MAATDATDWDAILTESRCQVLHRRNSCMMRGLKGAIGRLSVPLGLLAVLTGAGVQIRPTATPRPDCKTILLEGER
jgi:hypothetical protein